MRRPQRALEQGPTQLLPFRLIKDFCTSMMVLFIMRAAVLPKSATRLASVSAFSTITPTTIKSLQPRQSHLQKRTTSLSQSYNNKYIMNSPKDLLTVRYLSSSPQDDGQSTLTTSTAAKSTSSTDSPPPPFNNNTKGNKKTKSPATEQQQLVVVDSVNYLDVNEEDQYPCMGDLERVMSRSQTKRNFVNICDLENNDNDDTSNDNVKEKQVYNIGDQVWIRGRLHSIRVKGGSCFLVLRQDAFYTVQVCYFKDKENPEASKQMLQYLKTLTVESIVDVQGILVEANVKSCSITTRELKLQRIHAVGKAEAILPFLVEDAARTEAEVTASQETPRPFPRLGQELRLDHRWLDLRVPSHNAIMRIQSAICQLFRESLLCQGFIEIHTPKLHPGESESGAGVFTTDYFGRTACLAQSPQLYKQMAIASDLGRVFEIGPVFRAEKSHTRRHLCEFTGLDIEMSIHDHYMEALQVIHSMFKHIFHGLETRYAKELAMVRQQYESDPVEITDDPCVLHWPEAMEILQGQGFDIGDGYNDLNGSMELALGRVVKEKYKTDFFILDKYPSKIRPFYTMPDPDDPFLSNSYDIFLRGQEICSGAQRCHDPDLLVEILKEKNIEVGDGLEPYIESFRHGVSPHAGAGIGLERVVFLYLGLDNVRKASMFPRDPNRCTP